jgi:GNAT superfamily N-acetyltransferase
LPNAFTGALSADECIAAAEAFYGERGLPPMFQVSDACQPPDLDERLARRGYAIDAPVSVETVSIDAYRMAGQPPQVATSVLGTPSEEWLGISVDRGRFAGKREPYLGILSRIGTRGGFALARWKGKPIAVGLGVIDGDWLGIFSMLTVPETRRRRAATAILGALVGWASPRGATRAFLQVEKTNEPARALYRASGFLPAYGYHYRVK